MLILDMVFSLAHLIAVASLAGAIDVTWPQKPFRIWLQGLAFGLAAIIVMLKPFHFASGIFFDSRSIMLSLCGLFYGPLATALATALSLAARLLIGGAGRLFGSLFIVWASLMGLAFRAWLARRQREPGMANLVLLSILAHLPVPLSASLAGDVMSPVQLVLSMSLVIGLIFPIGTVAAGWVLITLKRSWQVRTAAQQSRDFLESVFNHANAPILIWDTAFKVIRCNQAAEQLAGRSQAEIVDHPLENLFPSYQRALIMQLIRDSLHGPRLENMELSIARKNQELRIVRWNSATVYAEDETTPLAGMAQGIDITDFKNAEQQLRANEAKWRSYINHAPIGIVVIDRFGRIRESNQTVTHITGWSSGELAGTSIIQLLSANSQEQRHRQFEQLLRSSENQAEFAIRRPDGERRHIAVNAASLVDHQFILFITDISHKKTIENVMRAIAASNLTGDGDIFRFLAQQLATALRKRGALIAEIESQGSLQARTLAVCDRGHLVANFDFNINNILPSVIPQAVNLAETAADDHTLPDLDLASQLPGLHSYLSLSLHDSTGSISGLIAILDDQPIVHDSNADSILQIFAARAAAELERRKTEQKYQLLFNRILEGFAIHDIICDQAGRPIDYRFLAVNPAFEKLTGLKAVDILGKTVLQVLPETEAYWIDGYGRVALDGEPLEFEAYSEGINRFYHTTAFQTQYKQFACIITDITDRRIHEAQIKQSLHEKEILLKEVHHRVKNNLNIVASLLSLQSGHTNSREDAITAFANSRDQIMSMALVHEELYQSSDYSNVNMPSYIARIKTNLVQLYHSDKPISIETDIHDIKLDVNTAIPCSLILNEMITNSFKYAFQDRPDGTIRISLKHLDSALVRLDYTDNGRGLPPDFDIAQSASLGLTLIQLLSGQIDGRLHIDNEDGLHYQLDFPLVLTRNGETARAASQQGDTDHGQ
ncbi:MAG: hypothetical protein A2087_09930 [Spirochaetes bacterium GWD1_61_31]|nr:MAG: hypothetical protein A2Y37_07225 [Spirochaetes bacterium GWB1_60_80]OHD34011.1 MAG: hypothetical protein A2004_02155 [Spirochaetes bacterium GWC1_61_12]OHD41391.1 MAG: hypothetical protein A2Y35_05470 [Spirochaetes bacterium GWE1_60_18]OHD41554.1 MAG: hypothetical protein A2087_09930 [Spirochaetes bacterium GWD1_61_31]OHD59188.1 MAG: hypothetical protein A2Y32_00185 [Spirochaetes bacterium GWF1_60_12]